MNILHDMGLAIVVSDAAEQNDICCPLNDIIMGKNVTLWSMNHMNVNHIDVDENTVDDGFESHGNTEEMVRNDIIDVLNIKENTSPVNADNIYRMDSDYTVDDDFESHESTEEMLRNGIFDELNIKIMAMHRIIGRELPTATMH